MTTNNVGTLDQDYLVKLAEQINTSWPNLYQATVSDKQYNLENLDGGITTVFQPNGRLNIRHIPERTSNEAQHHFAAVELLGDIDSIDGEIANITPTSIRAVSSGNRGLIKTKDIAISSEIVNYQVNLLKERKSHFVQPPASYCDLPYLYPIIWVSLHHPWMDNPEFVDFNIVGTVTMTEAEINAIPALDDLGDLAKWIVRLVCPIRSFFDDDTLYNNYHRKGLIDDSYRPSTKEW